MNNKFKLLIESIIKPAVKPAVKSTIKPVIKYAFLSLLLLFILTGNAFSQTVEIKVESKKDPSYNSLFRRKTGWTGADGAYSLKFSKNKVLWLYGDTFLGDIKDGKRVNEMLVNNSIAIQDGIDPKTATVKFYTGKKVKGKSTAFITPEDRKGWFWFFDGIRNKKGLYLFLMHIERTSKTDVFGFRQIGSSIAYINNPDEDPSKWNIQQKKIPFCIKTGAGSINFGCSIFKHGKYTYIYGIREVIDNKQSIKSMIAARTPSENLTDFDKWRFYSKGKWVLHVKDAGNLVKDVATEYSVSYLPGLKKFVMVYSKQGFSPEIVARFSSTPKGPWGKPVSLYECPEFDKKRGVFCYAGKAHPELNDDPMELIITYADNTFDFELLKKDATLYWPFFIRVKLNVVKNKS